MRKRKTKPQNYQRVCPHGDEVQAQLVRRVGSFNMDPYEYRPKMVRDHSTGRMYQSQLVTTRRRWVDLGPWLQKARDFQKAMDTQGKSFDARWGNGERHVVGKLGEVCFQIETGGDPNEIDWEVYEGGDGFNDCPKRNVWKGLKASVRGNTAIQRPFNCFPCEQQVRPMIYDVYVLVLVELTESPRGNLCGWNTAGEMREAKLVDWGLGPQHSIPWFKTRVFFDP